MSTTEGDVAMGYGVVDKDGRLLVDTMSPHPRGARVNWLYTHARVMVQNHHTEDEIEKMFLRQAAMAGAKLHEVAMRLGRDLGTTQ